MIVVDSCEDEVEVKASSSYREIMHMDENS